jgi:5S rRNA maturation endonuclease (ribonuclease M5)
MSNLKSAHEIIVESLARYGGRQKSTSDHRMVQCCFHEDGSPSLGVYVNEGLSIPLGSWHCFGCGEKGSWNKLAEKCGFEKFPNWGINLPNYTKSITIDDTEHTIDSMLNSMHVGSTSWPRDVRWRGFDGDVVISAGGMLIDDSYSDGIGVFFPVFIGNALKGGIRAAFIKEAHTLSYVTTKGAWVKKYGLFLYEPVKKMHKDYIVLVEGPRDALRLYSKGIPALAILGSQNFGAEKALIISSLCASTVICLPDNDKAGIEMKGLVKKYMPRYCKTISIKLPKSVEDPCNMSEDDIENLRNILEDL